jgi:hypothetical protein
MAAWADGAAEFFLDPCRAPVQNIRVGPMRRNPAGGIFMTKLLAAITVSLLSSAPAFAAADAAEDKKERVICKRGQETGSRTRSPNLCFTASEWRMLAKKREGDRESNLDGGRVFGGGIDTPVTANPRSPQ